MSVLTVATLAACSSLAPQQPSQGTGVNAQNAIQRTGKFALLVFDKTQDKNTDSVQGNFLWNGVGENVVLDLSSPLGQTLARVEVLPGYSKLTRSSGEVFEAPNPDALVAQVIGQEIPVSGLRYWIKGQKIPNQPLIEESHDNAGKLTSFKQAGWDVTMSDYDSIGPTKFNLIRNQTTERIKIRLIVQ